MLGAQSQASLGGGLGGTSSGGLFGNQARLGGGVASGTGLFSSAATQNKLGGGLGGGLFGQQQPASQAGGLFGSNTGGGLFNNQLGGGTQLGAGTQLGTGLGSGLGTQQTQVSVCVEGEVCHHKEHVQ